MSREFLTWGFLETYYEMFRIIAARNGALLTREQFAELQLMPVMKPGAIAQLFGMGAEIVGMQTPAPILPQRPVPALNGRK